MSALTATGPAPDWPRRLRRGIALTLLVKLLVLIALKTAFFSAEHRVEVTPAHVDAQLFPAQRSTDQQLPLKELSDD